MLRSKDNLNMFKKLNEDSSARIQRAVGTEMVEKVRHREERGLIRALGVWSTTENSVFY